MGSASPSSDPLHTPLCDLLGIRYPIVKAPMGNVDTPELVAAVSNAGGLGVLAAVGLPPDRLREAIRAIRALTDRPFGVNLILPPPERGDADVAAAQRFLDAVRQELGLPSRAEETTLPPLSLEEPFAVIFEERVPIFSTHGDPRELIADAHAAGATVVSMVATVDEAVAVVAAGADAVVVQGYEAGGVRATFRLGPGHEAAQIGTLALVPQAVDAVDVPVLAAGGIMDGRGVAAALALGAAGVQMGTRFIPARESGIPGVWRQRLLAATETDTTVSRAFTGRPTRALRNRISDAYAASGAEPLPFPAQAMAAGDIYAGAAERGAADYLFIAAGQGLRLLRDGQGGGEIVAELVAEARAVLARLCPPAG